MLDEGRYPARVRGRHNSTSAPIFAGLTPIVPRLLDSNGELLVQDLEWIDEKSLVTFVWRYLEKKHIAPMGLGGAGEQIRTNFLTHCLQRDLHPRIFSLDCRPRKPSN